ncbi:MAG: helix-turn-helix domain-containing protein [Ilumatobacteraceae bacterium]
MSDAAAADEHPHTVDEGAAVRRAVASTMRRSRMARGMSLRDMAAATGLSTALLSQVERETANPTVAALTRIAQALDLSFGELVRTELTRPEIIRADLADPASVTPSARMLFAMMDRRRFDISEGRLPPNTAGVFSDHGRGSVEHGYVVTGSVVLTVGDERFHLGAGDAVRFASSVPHAYSTDDRAATLLTVVVYDDE